MEPTLNSYAEEQAVQAESLSKFSGIKLLHIKKQIASISSLIGRDNIFDQYTKHDISHVNHMLTLCDHIIPKETKDIMQPADWLLLVLSIYLHDLGMLVTNEEYTKKDQNLGFLKYKKSIDENAYGLEYKNKINDIEESKKERFLYQEFVRKTHGERIKYWILNEGNPLVSVDLQIVTEIQSFIGALDSLFIQDLAQVCESHQLSDLDNFEKYKIKQAYGMLPTEVCNVFYVALILRTADLLHITSDRTPSVEYRLIAPTDPISQVEWAKQCAVNSILPQSKVNEDGNIDDNIPKDSFEVNALFKDDKGFFGLSSYLIYANNELINSYRLNEAAKKHQNSKYDFPWKRIDDSKIQALGFDKRQFQFVLDQNKILDLLVGHTLYNDPTVVLRELTQNSIDACRLYKYDNSKSAYTPSIIIQWDENKRELTFTDNGCGMDLDIIENHLLKVGSSRYQDEKFIKTHENFSSISRFGIGLLTCFMIADDVDILTKTADSERDILLKIRKVHGKYLLKYGSDDPTHSLNEDHGTSIKLFIRESVVLDNIEEQLKKWILFPECNISLSTKDGKIRIGYDSPKDMLKEILKDLNYQVDDESYKIEEYKDGGVEIAFALKYSEFLKKWDIIGINSEQKYSNIPTGISIEGIRVDFQTPGYDSRKFISIANISGKDAPRTNVSRSSVENTIEREKMYYTIYNLYLKFIATQLKELEKHFSISWIANEASFILNNFFSNSDRWQYQFNTRPSALISVEQFEKSLRTFNCMLIEKDNIRETVSVNNLISYGHYWTVDCRAFSAADDLVREIKTSNQSTLSIMSNIHSDDSSNTDHIDILLCAMRYRTTISELLYSNFQVTTFKLIPDQRRVDTLWESNKDKMWYEFTDVQRKRSYNAFNCFVQRKNAKIKIDSADYNVINTTNGLFILEGTDIHEYIVSIIDKTETSEIKDFVILLLNAIHELLNLQKDKIQIENVKKVLDSTFDNVSSLERDELIDVHELAKSISSQDIKIYDTSAWYKYRF